MTAHVIPTNVHGAVDHAPKVIPLRYHLAIDAAAGATLAAFPWLTGSRKRGFAHWLPHALVGAGTIALAALTRTEPRRTKVDRMRNALRLR